MIRKYPGINQLHESSAPQSLSHESADHARTEKQLANTLSDPWLSAVIFIYCLLGDEARFTITVNLSRQVRKKCDICFCEYSKWNLISLLLESERDGWFDGKNKSKRQ